MPPKTTKQFWQKKVLKEKLAKEKDEMVRLKMEENRILAEQEALR